MLLSERSQSERATNGMAPSEWHSGKGDTMEAVEVQGLPGVGGGGDEGEGEGAERRGCLGQ